MASNRFDTSQQQQYTSQYVPLPFEAISAMGEKSQKKYDTAIDDTYKLKDLMAKVPAINDPNLGLSNIQKKKELDTQYTTKINELTDKIVNGDPNAFRELEKVKRDLINDPTRQELENSYLDYQAYKKDMIDKKDSYAAYKDPYRNKKLINDAGELQAFRYSGMGEKQNHAEEARAQMAGVATWGYDTKNSYLDPNDGNIYTKTSKGTYVKDTRIRDLANKKAGDFVKTQKGQDYLELLKYENPKATPEELFKGVSNYLFNAGSNQIFSNSGGGSDVQTTGLTDKRDEEKRQAAAPMPTLENAVQGSDAPLTSKSGLGWLGLNTDILNDDGSFNSKAYKSQGTDLIKDVKENIKDGSVVVTDIFGNKTTHKTLTDAFSEFKKKPAPNLLTKYYTDLLNSAKGLGIEIPMEAGNKSKTDFVKLQKQLADYGQNMQSQGSTSAGFNARFANNLSDYFLGSVSADAAGNVTFKKSPLLNSGSIIDQATGKSISENKEEIAQSGTLKGVNYFASDAGTYKLVSKGKSYNYHPGDQTLNAMTQNTHSLTQDIVKARQGKQNSSTVLEPATTGVDASGRVVNIPAKTVKTYADNIVNGLKENFKTIPANDPQGLFLANHLQENLNKLKGYEQVSVKTSDIVTDKNTPKYQYIAYQHKGFGTTSEADDKVLRIDTETGQTEVLSLGDIHASERDYLQKSYAPAFEQTKQ